MESVLYYYIEINYFSVWCEITNNLSIPAYCWKIIYIKKQRTYEAHAFKNDSTATSWTWTIADKKLNTDAAIMKIVKVQSKIFSK